MRLRKPLSILLSLSMIAGMSAFASNAAVTSDESVSAGNYYNANYLESYASKAYNESGLGFSVQQNFHNMENLVT